MSKDSVRTTTKALIDSVKLPISTNAMSGRVLWTILTILNWLFNGHFTAHASYTKVVFRGFACVSTFSFHVYYFYCSVSCCPCFTLLWRPSTRIRFICLKAIWKRVEKTAEARQIGQVDMPYTMYHRQPSETTRPPWLKTRALNKNQRPSNTVSLNKFHVMQLGASKYSVYLSVCSFLSLSKFCVLAPSDVMSKHTKKMKTQTKLA